MSQKYNRINDDAVMGVSIGKIPYNDKSNKFYGFSAVRGLS